MLLSESLAVKLIILKNKRKRSSVHQIYKNRLNFGEFHHFYVELRADDNLFQPLHVNDYKYFFDYIKEAIDDECHHVTTNFKTLISVEDRIIITFR